jgi:hypothetical protein
MKLVQKRFLFGTYEFELAENELRVSIKKPLSANRFTVPLSGLKSAPSYFRSFPLLWLIFATVFGGVAGLTLFGMIHDAWVEDKSGFIGMFIVMMSAAIACLIGFYQKRVDFVILHARNGGYPLVFIHRTLPSEVHVREFVEILRERIEAAPPP